MAHHTEQAGFPDLPLTPGLRVVLEARSPTTDAEVAGVSATRFSIFGYDESDDPQPEPVFPVLVVPIGVLAALYLREYAKQGALVSAVRIAVNNLAGVPSIVFGILGFAVFVKTLRGVTGGKTLLAGGITVAILVLPIVIITAAEALRAVPNGIREAGFGVGATRWEVILRVLRYNCFRPWLAVLSWPTIWEDWGAI